MQTNPIPQVQPIVYIAQKYPFRDHFLEASQNHSIIFCEFGITQIILGIISTSLGITLVLLSKQGKWMVPDIWCGVFFFITGLLVVLSARYKTKCLVVASLSSAVFSSLCAPILFGVNVFGVIMSSDWVSNDSAVIPNIFEIQIAQALIAILAFVCSIVHASYCSNCCGCETSQSCCLPDQPIVTTAIDDPKTVSYQPQLVQSVPKNYLATGLLPNTQQPIQQPAVITSSLPQQQSVHQLQKQTRK